MNKKALEKFVSVLGGANCRVSLIQAEEELEVAIQETCELGILAKDKDGLMFIPYSSIIYVSEIKKPGKKV